MDRICWSKKGQAMVQIFLETSGNSLNSNSESIRLLKKLLNWKNSFTGSSKKTSTFPFFKNKNALSQNYLDKTKWIAPSFFCWSQSLKKSSSSVAPNYKRGNFVKSASCQFRSRQNVSADSKIGFSPVSFQAFPSNIRLQSKVSSGCSFHHHPLPPSAPESEVSHLGWELRLSGDDGPRQEKFADRRDKNVCRGGSAKNGTRHREVKFQPRWNYFGDSRIWGLETRRLAKLIS